MTSPRQSRGAPPFDALAQDVIAESRGERPGYYPPPALPEPPLTEQERAEAEKAERAAKVCRFCIGIHYLPNSPGCPRLASFELDGDGHLKAGTFFPGKAWAKGRVVLFEDTKEEADDASQ